MKKILIVEDDVKAIELYKEALTLAEFEVLTASTGSKAFTILQTVKPDLIILDIMLPEGMNGFDILQKLKGDTNLQTIPVIVLTNLDTQHKEAMEIGAADYFVKPNTTLDQLVLKAKSLTSSD